MKFVLLVHYPSNLTTLNRHFDSLPTISFGTLSLLEVKSCDVLLLLSSYKKFELSCQYRNSNLRILKKSEVSSVHLKDCPGEKFCLKLPQLRFKS